MVEEKMATRMNLPKIKPSLKKNSSSSSSLMDFQ